MMPGVTTPGPATPGVTTPGPATQGEATTGPATPKVALTIAGSDSGGGAGIQADLKTFAALGVHGTCAVTAVTAQNTTAVLAVVAVAPDMVAAQVEAVVTDLVPAAVKTGMLANPAIVAAVADLAAAGALPNLVVDPVLVSTSGHLLMDEGGVEAYRALLLPHATVVTPNLREAAVLTGRRFEDLATVEAMTAAAEDLRALGSTTVVVKGGHADEAGAPGDVGSPDVIVGPAGVVVLQADRVRTTNDHGTGCSLSAAIAAHLALGASPVEAIERAKALVRWALAGAAGWQLGAGHGPIDHFGWSAADPGGATGPP
ncbi:MAG: bifunctional hydroxymethylpyrimidine kinase/phosphomethylpyrimidine kinase [Acidimicrobiales bacterium]